MERCVVCGSTLQRWDVTYCENCAPGIPPAAQFGGGRPPENVVAGTGQHRYCLFVDGKHWNTDCAEPVSDDDTHAIALRDALDSD